MLNDILQFRADITNASYLSGVQWTAVSLCTIHYSKSSLQLYTSGRVQSTLLTQANQWLKSLTITILTLFMPTITVIITSHQHVLTVGVLCTAITDEGSRRLPKLLKIVYLLASVNEPQSCVWDVCDWVPAWMRTCVCVCVQVWVIHCLWCVWQCPNVDVIVYMLVFATMWS